MPLDTRWYQDDIIASVNAKIDAGQNRPAVVAATGLGKTVTFTHWLVGQLAARPRQRAMVCVNRDELATQARDTIHAVAPQLRPGIVMGSQSDHERQVIVASVQTISRPKRRDVLHSIGTIVVDEAHHAAAPTWKSTLEHFGAFAGVPTVGFTATMSRADGKGLGEIWQDVVTRPDGGAYDTLWGIRNGFLCDVRGIRVKVPQLDLSGVHIRAGDLQQEETAERMLDANTGSAIVRSIRDVLEPQHGKRRGVVFAPNVATALDFALTMNEAGIPTGTILGSTPKDERARIYAAFRTGELEWITNAMVLTEGWDAPWCDALIIARPTRHAGLYQQMVGRGLRMFPGKAYCVVMDVVGATEMHGLASLVDLSTDRKAEPREGQSLLEAMDEWEAEDAEAGIWTPVPQPVHRVVATEVDMFGQSHSLWLKTFRGTWFIPAGDSLFFLWPLDDGTFHLGMTPKGRSEVSTMLHDEPVDLSIGMALAEQYAAEYVGAELTGKDAPWRQTGAIRPGQKRDMELWGLEPKRRMTAAEAFDEINRAIASYRLDPVRVA